jgi:hypothetical protein
VVEELDQKGDGTGVADSEGGCLAFRQAGDEGDRAVARDSMGALVSRCALW